jgi:acetyl esterase/lipase
MAFKSLLLISALITMTPLADAAVAYVPFNSIPIWPHLAPSETTANPGEQQAFRKGENPPVLRIQNITQPLLQVFLPKSKPTQSGVLILPGGGYGKVVTNKEGSEAALWLNQLGIAAFVLSYRTTSPDEPRQWFRPLQDSQRAMRVIRSNAKEWHVAPDQIGLIGFSAGGQVAAIHLADTFHNAYDLIDKTDTVSHYPNFSLLIYPWNTMDSKTGELKKEIHLGSKTPPTFLVHTDDDQSTSLGTVAIYSALKKMGISAELHIYQNGGHGYGMRKISGSLVHTWSDRASEWLVNRGIGNPIP